MTVSGTPGAEYAGVTTPPRETAVDLLCVPVFEDETDWPDLAGIDAATGGEIARARQSGEFGGKAYELFVTPVTADWKARRIALVGAGRKADWDVERMKRVAMACGYAARARAAGVAGFVARGGDLLRIARAAADGMSAAEFEIGAYRRPSDTRPAQRVVVVAPGVPQDELSRAVTRGRITGQAVNAARDLANQPGNVLTPRVFASRVTALASAAGLGVDVLDDARIRALNMGLLLGVAQGSAEPPQIIVLRHEPAGAPPTPVIGLVGKGITFDSGGISIKPAEGMDRMKSDMSGGAAVAAAMQALARLQAPVRVIGVIPTAENMPGGRAMRPGDVVTGAGGKSVEVLNTDAEGRLILGDALWYARQLGATHLVDVATLTGACVVALGHYVSGLFGNDPAWVERLRNLAADAGDRVWPMPIYEEAREQMKSDIADLVNSGGRYGGAVTAAVFLREFAGEGPWAHLDIAGTAWAEKARPYLPKGPTGAAVRLLIELGMSGA